MRKTREESPAARAHIETMAENYRYETSESARNSRIYGPNASEHLAGKGSRIISSIQDSLMSAYEARERFVKESGKVCILNFADYTRRGGLYLYGSHAQEEALCSESNLWNILNDPILDSYFDWNKKNQNNYLYYDRAIYSPGVIFTSERLGSKPIQLDVLSCAAPNKSAAGRYKHVATEESKAAMKQRIAFVRNVLENEHVDVAVLGAFGCGVFGNSTNYVAAAFVDALWDSSIPIVIFALPDTKKKTIFEKYIEPQKD